MTVGHGFGMLTIGMVVIGILGAGFLYVINTQEKIRKEEQKTDKIVNDIEDPF